MFNLFKAELFRFFKSVSFKVLIILIPVFSLIPILFQKVNMLISTMTYEVSLAEMLVSELAGGTLILFSISFIALFCNTDRKSGSLKNIASRISKKEYIALSKFFIVILIYIIIIAEWSLASLIFGKIFFGSDFILAFSSSQVAVVAMSLLFHITFGTMIMMLTILLKGTAAPITIGIFWSGGIVSLVYMLIDLLVYKLSKNQFELNSSRISLVATMQSINTSSVSESSLRFFIVAAVYLAIGLFVSMLVYKKRDI